MTRLSDVSKKKKHKTSGSYGRLFNDDEIGLVISDVQSTAIRNGNELEGIIEHYSNPLTQNETNELIASINNNKVVEKRTYLLSKKSYRNTEIAIPNHEPDYIVLQVDDKNLTAIVIEMKDSDDFDTKKSNGELETLTKCCDFISNHLGINATCALCCFNQTSHKRIMQGLKNRFDEAHVMTGAEFCELVDIDYKSPCGKTHGFNHGMKARHSNTLR